MERLANAVESAPALRHLSISNARVKPSAAKHLGKALLVNRRIRLLDLGGNRLGNPGALLVARVITEQSFISELNLSQNGITRVGIRRLAEVLPKAKHLRKLSLSGNPIGNDGAAALGNAFSRGCTLEELDISMCNIDARGLAFAVEGLYSNHRLRCFYLGKNKIHSDGVFAIRTLLSRNTSLRILAMESCDIGDRGGRALADAVRTHPSLEVLQLAGNRCSRSIVSEIESSLRVQAVARLLDRGNQQLLCVGGSLGELGLRRLASAIGNHSHLRTVDLSSTGLGAGLTITMCTALVSHHSLEVLILDDNRIGDAGANAVAGLLNAGVPVAKLFLSGCDIGDKGVAAVASAIRDSPYLTSLDLADNTMTDIGGNALLRSMQGNASVRELTLSNDYMSDSVEAACSATAYRNYVIWKIKKGETVEEILMPQSSLGSDGTQRILNTLSTSSVCTRLSLAHNGLRASGAAAVAVFLGRDMRLAELDMSDNAIGEDGFAAVGDALRSNSTLKKLFLDRNMGGEEGIVKFCAGLADNSTLEWLSLSENAAGPNGAQALGVSLARHASLSHLWLGENGIGDEGCERFGNEVRRNQSMRFLFLNSNQIASLGMKALIGMMGNCALRGLDMYKNKLDDSDADTLVGRILRWKHLHHIDIRENACGNEHAVRAAVAAKRSRGDMDQAECGAWMSIDGVKLREVAVAEYELRFDFCGTAVDWLFSDIDASSLSAFYHEMDVRDQEEG